MASVMAIRGEVFGSCVGEVDVSVEVEISQVWLCCWWKYLRLFGAGKWLKIVGGVGMVPGIGWLLGALEVIEEIKSPCRGRSLAG